MVEDEALVGQLPQGGGALGVHGQGGKALRHNPDQIFSLKVTGPQILRSGRPLREPLMGAFQPLVLLVGDQGLEVDGKGVEARDGLRRGAGTVGDCWLQVGGRLVGSRLRAGVGGVGLNAEEDPAQLQLGLGEHAEILHLQLGGGGAVVDVPQGEHPAAAQQHKAHGEQLDGGGHSRHPDALPLGQRIIRDQPLPEPQSQQGGHHHCQNGEPVGQHVAHRHLAEGLGHHGHLCQGEDGEKGLEQVVVDHLGAHPDRHQPGAQRQQHPPEPDRGSAAQQAQQYGDGRGEQKGKYRALHRKGVEAVQL